MARDGDIQTIVQGIDLEFIVSVDYEAPLQRDDMVFMVDAIAMEVEPATLSDMVFVTDTIALYHDNLRLADNVDVVDSPPSFVFDYGRTFGPDAVAITESLEFSDPGFPSVKLLMHGFGPNGGQNYGFLDGSHNGYTINTHGVPVPAQGSPSPYVRMGGSVRFNGDIAQYLSLMPDADLNIPTGDYTIECWFYIEGNSVPNAFSARDATIATVFQLAPNLTGWSFYITGNAVTTGTGLHFEVLNADVSEVFDVPVAISQQAWHHVALSRVGATTRMFLDGVVIGTKNFVNPAVLAPAVLTLAHSPFGTVERPMLGRMSDLRIVKGTGLYAANFTPPSAPLAAITGTELLLNFTFAAIVDDARRTYPTPVANAQTSTSIFKFAPSSILFDGVGDYVTVPYSPDWEWGVGDYTVECWFYIAANSTPDGSGMREAVLLSTFDTSATGWGFSILGDGTTTGTGLLIEVPARVIGNVAISHGVWHHAAVSRVAGVTRLFLDGVKLPGEAALGDNNLYPGHALNIGHMDYPSYNREFNGRMQDIRVSKGRGRYVANFTPPTQPFPDY